MNSQEAPYAGIFFSKTNVFLLGRFEGERSRAVLCHSRLTLGFEVPTLFLNSARPRQTRLTDQSPGYIPPLTIEKGVAKHLAGEPKLRQFVRRSSFERQA